MIKLALEEKEKKDEKPLTVEQIKKITKYMRDHANRYGILERVPQPKVLTDVD